MYYIYENSRLFYGQLIYIMEHFSQQFVDYKFESTKLYRILGTRT